MIVRETIKDYLEKIEMETLKKALIEQCKDTAKLNLEICSVMILNMLTESRNDIKE